MICWANSAISIILKATKNDISFRFLLASSLWVSIIGTNQHLRLKARLKNKVLQKTMFEKKQDPAEQLHKELRILKCPDMVIHKITYSCPRLKLIKNLQNHLFNWNTLVTTTTIKHVQNPQYCLIFPISVPITMELTLLNITA